MRLAIAVLAVTLFAGSAAQAACDWIAQQQPQGQTTAETPIVLPEPVGS